MRGISIEGFIVHDGATQYVIGSQAEIQQLLAGLAGDESLVELPIKPGESLNMSYQKPEEHDGQECVSYNVPDGAQVYMVKKNT